MKSTEKHTDDQPGQSSPTEKAISDNEHVKVEAINQAWYVVGFQAFILAMLLMTRIPVLSLLPLNRILPQQISNHLKSLSVLFYPLVGGIIALLIWAVYMLLPATLPTFLQAALLVSVWVALTGALHLDGLADSVDAAFASHKPKAQTLDIFRDPNAGPMAVVSLVLVLLLKVAAIDAILQVLSSTSAASFISVTVLIVILCSCILGRVLALVLIVTTPYARKNGMAEGFNLTSYRVFIIVVCALAVMALWFFESFFFHGSVLASNLLDPQAEPQKHLGSGLIVLLCLMGLSLWLWLWRRFWLNKIQGYTGDCVGALIEVAELIVLLSIILGIHASGIATISHSSSTFTQAYTSQYLVPQNPSVIG